MKKLNAYPVYLILEGASALFFTLVFTVNLVYQVTVVGLNPLQLVLVGTMLELTVLVCEVPTGVVADVTTAEGRAARVDAEQANRIKDQVLAAVSHELRAPLTTMVLWERVLRDPSADEPARAQALEAIRQSTTAQSRLVADLLDMSRAISGKLYVDFRNVEVGKLINAAVEASVPAAKAKGITLSHECTFEGEISGDASRLRDTRDRGSSRRRRRRSGTRR